MFDHITVEFPLPDGFTGKIFQTKSFDCLLQSYLIDSSGILYRLSQRNRWVRENFTGYIEFHTFSVDYYTNREWFEYCAEFIDGELVRLEVPDWILAELTEPYT